MVKMISETLLNIFICSPFFLDDALDDMICLINTDSILTFDHGNFEDI